MSPEEPGSVPGWPTPYAKLYVVVFAQLSAGLKAAMACHALRAFVGEFPALDEVWYRTSNNVVVLQCDDLVGLAARMDALGLACSRFHEPDRGDELTSLCVEPGGAYALRRLPLAGS